MVSSCIYRTSIHYFLLISFVFTAKCGKTSLLVILKGTLRSDNGDVHENVAEKQTSHHFKIFLHYPNLPCYLKQGDFGWS